MLSLVRLAEQYIAVGLSNHRRDFYDPAVYVHIPQMSFQHCSTHTHIVLVFQLKRSEIVDRCFEMNIMLDYEDGQPLITANRSKQTIVPCIVECMPFPIWHVYGADFVCSYLLLLCSVTVWPMTINGDRITRSSFVSIERKPPIQQPSGYSSPISIGIVSQLNFAHITKTHTLNHSLNSLNGPSHSFDWAHDWPNVGAIFKCR